MLVVLSFWCSVYVCTPQLKGAYAFRRVSHDTPNITLAHSHHVTFLASKSLPFLLHACISLTTTLQSHRHLSGQFIKVLGLTGTQQNGLDFAICRIPPGRTYDADTISPS